MVSSEETEAGRRISKALDCSVERLCKRRRAKGFGTVGLV
jgi:hypothetical protein